jgi:hypothetical protein
VGEAIIKNKLFFFADNGVRGSANRFGGVCFYRNNADSARKNSAGVAMRPDVR